ncbi:MAG: M24 family metallopeptidase [Planctomycetes bacterium]|nr:M24 family metallopeptidase [Planctomycetota bacterium]
MSRSRWNVFATLLAFAPGPGERPRAARNEEMPPAVYATRRASLLEQLDEGAVAVLFAAPVHERNHDVDHSYRPASDFWYLTGFGEPGAAVVITRRDGAPYTVLFVPPADAGHALWNGARLGVEGAAPLADEVRSNATLKSGLAELLKGARAVLARDEGDRDRGALLDAALLEAALPAGILADGRELHAAIGRLRLIKDEHEIALLQRAVDISAVGHVNAMRHAKPGRYEFEVEAVIEASFAMQGSRRVGYDSIVGAGANSCVLHYQTNRTLIPEDATIVIDVGAEYGMYTADITRTLPSGGRFTKEQRLVYQAVLDAQEAAIAEVKPGATLAAINRTARRVMSEALVKSGVVKSSDQAMSLQPHGVSHWLGLDVHDDCPYGAEDGRGEMRLAPGMVLTVEPGCYIAPGTAGVDARFHAIGVRIEDDVLVTADGCVVLSEALPKTIAEVERQMAEESAFPRLLDQEPRR